MKQLRAMGELLFNNAMLYKDLTQWMRTKSFMTLYLGLLLVAEMASLMVSAFSPNPGTAGPVTFGILTTILSLYTLVIAGGGSMATSREFQDRTFELYAMAGMSLEKMVLGKLGSLIGQFLFGFFCIVPFMFFAYLLGGIDFYSIFGTLLLLLLIAVPLFLISLLTSLSGSRKGGLRGLNRFGPMVVIIFLAWNLLPMMFLGYRGTSGFGVSSLLKNLMALDRDTWFGVASFLAIYTQFCLLFFYLAAHALRPSTDSREVAIKLLLTTLIVSWLGLSFYFGISDSDWFFIGLYPVFVLLCIVGLIFFHQPLKVPVMVRRRRSQSRYFFVRLAHWLFEPGPAGTYRMIIAVLAFVGLYGYCVHLNTMGHYSLAGKSKEMFISALSLPFQVPFFLIFPVGLIYGYRRTIRFAGGIRTFQFAWWVIAGIILEILLAVNHEGMRHIEAMEDFILLYVSLFISPISSVFSEMWYERSALPMASVYMPRFIVGGVSLVLMAMTLRHRRALEPDSTLGGDPAPPLSSLHPVESAEVS